MSKPTLLIDTDEVAYKAALRGETTLHFARKVSDRLEGENPDTFKPTPEELLKFGRKYKLDLYADIIGDSDCHWDVSTHKVPGSFGAVTKAIRDTVEFYLTKTGSENVLFCLGTGDNFRFDVAEINPYKGTRGEKPEMLGRAIDYIKEHYLCRTMDGVETDDVLGLVQTSEEEGGNPNGGTLIVSQDKDLRTIPGLYFDQKTKQIANITPNAGLFFLYQQILMGDATDNIRTIPGIGPKKAEKILEAAGGERAMARAIYDTYEKAMQKPLEKRSSRSSAVSPLPSIEDRTPASVILEITKLVYIQRADRPFESLEIVKLCRAKENM